MIHPAPTTPIAPTLARGVLESASDSHLVIEFPNTSYQLHLVPTSPVASPVGKRIVGTIRAQARRVDVVNTGGSYVEPVAGRPRRVQGRVVSTDAQHNTIVVNAGMPIHLALTDQRQHAGQFQIGDLVSTDVLDGATFTPQ